MAEAINDPQARFLAQLSQGRFMLQRDPLSDRAVFPPRLRAPGHGGTLTDFFPVSGRGIVYSVTVQPKRPPDPDRVIVLVDLEEGARMLSHMPNADPENVAIGDKVIARIVTEGETPMVVFDPAP
ncbi:Zn-ribbon domain-containing OB-fold protein [Hoeflea poritis]|uniref:OB-fold domain-containing protein n=1 Tax=Hoeflea poritis TaxID=2993659 RepID=A0ABT4VK70_9HYPH|nr:OB-fold domain-containing protein [Hoeflea poritis]MDA4845116.1 OB-fold domain-containing protein [Hoeflea poritis]